MFSNEIIAKNSGDTLKAINFGGQQFIISVKEDILFAYLVKELFKISVVGVKYKDHMATALYIPMQGDSVRVNSRKFIIADPTYINSNIGEGMKKYKNIKPNSFIFLTDS